ncbi:thioredoxin [Coralliovum pocilloporae]|uniref:thioredoxin n=1 Tax=Coralliovum pocilloporae TaxID=3066369 RepID=UPI00330700B4
MATINVTDASFQEDVLNSSEPVVVDFWAPWCGPCKALSPLLEDAAADLGGKVKVAKVNVDENQAVAANYGVRSIPMLLIFKDGEPAAMKIGVGGLNSKNDVVNWINGEV